jgi:hypothetical protein
MRRRFKPNLWARPTDKDKDLGVKRNEMPRSIRRHFPKFQDRQGSTDTEKTKGSNHHHHSDQVLPELERQYSTSITETNVEEVWFAGAHCGTNLQIGETHH